MVMAAFLLLGECRSQTTERVESTAPHVGKSSAEVSVAPLLEAVHQLTGVGKLSLGILLLSVTRSRWVSHTVSSSESTHSGVIIQEIPQRTQGFFDFSLQRDTPQRPWQFQMNEQGHLFVADGLTLWEIKAHDPTDNGILFNFRDGQCAAFGSMVNGIF